MRCSPISHIRHESAIVHRHMGGQTTCIIHLMHSRPYWALRIDTDPLILSEAMTLLLTGDPHQAEELVPAFGGVGEPSTKKIIESAEGGLLMTDVEWNTPQEPHRMLKIDPSQWRFPHPRSGTSKMSWSVGVGEGSVVEYRVAAQELSAPAHMGGFPCRKQVSRGTSVEQRFSIDRLKASALRGKRGSPRRASALRSFGQLGHKGSGNGI